MQARSSSTEGVQAPELLGDAGEPLDGRAGEGGHAHVAALEVAQVGRTGMQPALGVADVLDERGQVRALGGGPHASVVAHQQGGVQLLLQRVHKIAHAGLRVAQLACGLFEAAGLHNLQERLVFLVGHGFRPLLAKS